MAYCGVFFADFIKNQPFMQWILLFLMFILLPIHAKADQFYLLIYEQATSAKKFLENEEYLIPYCGCCTECKRLHQNKKGEYGAISKLMGWKTILYH